jgi:hypothetical protein
MAERIEAVAQQVDVTLDDQMAASVKMIVDGVPGRYASVAVLSQGKYDRHVEPRVLRIPTTVIDKTARYLLEHRDSLEEVTAAFASVTELFGEPVTPYNIELAIRDTIAGEDVAVTREAFELFTVGITARADPTTPHAQVLLNRSFAALQKLSSDIKGIFTADELALMTRAD